MDETAMHDRGCGGDLAAYALGALDEHEAERFAEHLRDCAVCRDELPPLQAVVDVLPLTVPAMQPRAALKRNVMSIVRAEQRAAAPTTRPRALRWPAVLGSPRLVSPRLGLALATVLAALLIGGGIALQGSGTPTTRVLSAQVLGQPGSAQVRLTGDHAELVLNHFAQPPAGHIYEVWVVRSGHAPAPTSALFGVPRDGSGDVDVPGSVRGVTTLMVTPEPVGGSAAPTHSPVIRATLS